MRVRSVVVVAAPFVVAWLVVAFFAGVYRSSSLGRVVLAWLVAWPIALALRAATGRGVPVSFDLVALRGERGAARRMARRRL